MALSSSQSTPGHEVVIAPGVLVQIGPLPITNTLAVSIAVSLLLVFLSLLATRHVKQVPGHLQNFFELIVEYIYEMSKELAHNKVKTFFPIVATFFIFIITANWLGLFPGFGTVGFYQTDDGRTSFIPFLRAPTSDLNVTLGLALVSAAATHYFAVKYLSMGGYLKKWFSLNPILFFVGILEIVSEFTKVFSLSFRLFGNIFAGEEVLKTVSGLFAYVVPLPFYFLEIIVGFVQAAVFMMLTLVFMVILSQKHAENH